MADSFDGATGGTPVPEPTSTKRSGRPPQVPEIVRRLFYRGTPVHFPAVLPFGIGQRGGKSVLVPDELGHIFYPPGPKVQSLLIDRMGATYLRPPQAAYLRSGEMAIDEGRVNPRATRLAFGKEEYGTRFLGPADLEALTRHLWGLGPTGSGKTETQKSLVQQWMRLGPEAGGPFGLIFIDAKGPAVAEVAELVPYEREGDVLVLDPDPMYSDFVIPFNPLDRRVIDAIGPQNAAGAAMEVLEKAVGGWVGTAVGMEEVLRMTFRAVAVADEKPTMYGALRWISDESSGENPYRASLLPRLRELDVEVAEYFERDYERREVQQSALAARRRLRKLLMLDSIRHMLAVEDSVLDFSAVADKGLILLVRLTKDLGDAKLMLGTMVFQGIVTAGRERFRRVERDPSQAKQLRKLLAVVDEFQDFSKLAAIEEMLSQLRQAQFGLGLFNQFANQVAAALPAIFGNVANKIVFPLADADDALLVAKRTGGVLSKDDFLTATPYHPYVQVHQQGWYGVEAFMPLSLAEEEAAERQRMAQASREFRWPVDREADELDGEVERLLEMGWVGAARALSAMSAEDFEEVLRRVRERRHAQYQYLCENPGALPKLARIRMKSNLRRAVWRAEIVARLNRARAETITARPEELGAWWGQEGSW